MIIKQQVNDYVNTLQSKGKSLAIAVTAKSMDVLSRGLYSRPIEAVVRELGTNAYDAHVALGLQKKQFDVILPTVANPRFVVRDYGPGIEDNNVRAIFATYFGSDKTDSNDYVGCLGLGALSPLAVSSQFTVEIWRDGWYTLWLIYKDENGMPSMADEPQIRKETTDPTGVRITVPVDHTKVSAFVEAAQRVYQRFSVIPNVQGTTITQPAKTSTFENCWFEEGNGIYALMGNVLYPINLEIKGLEGYRGLTSKRMIIPFEIGQLEFEASREGLTYNPEVIGVLKIKLNSVINEFAKSVQEKISKEICAYDALVKYKEITRPMSDTLKSRLYTQVQFDGKPLNVYFPASYATNWSKDILLPNPDKKLIGEIYEITTSSYGRRQYYGRSSFEPSADIAVFYIDGKCVGKINRVVQYAQSFGPNQTRPKCILLNDGIDVDKWCEINFFPKDRLKKITELPAVPKSGKSGSTPRKRAGVFAIKGGPVKTYFWKACETPEAGYYFIKQDDDIVLMDKKTAIVGNYDYLKKLGVLPDPLYGISKSHLKDYQNDAQFIPAEVYIIEKLKKLHSTMVLAKTNEDVPELWAKIWPPEHKLAQVFADITKGKEHYRNFERVCTLFGIEFKADQKLKVDLARIYKDFPMLKGLSGYSGPAHSDVQSYIRDTMKAKGLVY